MLRHFLVGALCAASLIPIVSVVIYFSLFSLRLSYPEAWLSSNNTLFKHKTHSQCSDWENIDTSKYYFDEKIHLKLVQEVTIKSRDGGDVHAWLLTHNDTLRPVIVIVHGFRLSKHHYTVLLPAHMLYQNGYDIMAIDLRNHGKSFQTNLFATFGHTEHLDVLGAIDYLYNHSVTKVGIYGSSMGATTSLIATGEDDRIQAAFVDSPVCDVEELVKHHTSFTGYHLSSVLVRVSRYLAWIIGGLYPPYEYNTISALKKLKDRPIHFEHTELDVIVPMKHSETCSKIGSDHGAIVTTNFVASGGKVVPSLINNCWDHCVNVLSDPNSYQKRLTQFFNTYIPV